MNKCLQLLLSLTLAGSCMAAVVALVAHICEKWAPKRFLYLLWLPVLLSFWLPLGTQYSLFSLVEQAELPHQAPGVQQPSWTSEGEMLEATPDFVPVIQKQIAFQDLPVEQFLVSLWLLGAAGCLSWQTASYLWFRRQALNCAKPPEDWEQELMERLSPDGGPRLLRSEHVSGPLLMGPWSSALILPKHRYMPQVLEDILSHELCHWRRRDLGVKWLTMLTACLHWFNPVCWYLVGRVDRDCELACDEQVTARRDREQRLRYGRTLILVAAGGHAHSHGLTASMYTQKQQLKERLEYLMKEKKGGRRVTAAICVALLVVTLSTTVFGAHLGGEQQQLDLESIAAQKDEEMRPIMEEISKGVIPGVSGETPRIESSAGTEETYLVPVQMEKILLSTLYGSRVHPITGKSSSHNGIDIVAERGTDVLASRGGVVTVSGYEGTYGNYVVISHGDGQSTLYAQMSQRKVSEGDTVDQGEVIGLVGSTGASTGPHLHFEVRQDGACVDPLGVLELESVYLRGNTGEEVEYQIG